MSPEPWVQINLDLLNDKRVQMLLETNATALILFLRLLRDEVIGSPFKSYDPVDEDALLCLHQVEIVVGSGREGYSLSKKFLKEFTRQESPETRHICLTDKSGHIVRHISDDNAGPQDVTVGIFTDLKVHAVRHETRHEKTCGIIKRVITKQTRKRVVKKEELKKDGGEKNKKPSNPEFNADVQECLDVFIQATEFRFGFKPTISTAGVMQLRRYLKKHGKPDTLQVLNFYVSSEKASKLGCTLAQAFTDHTVNLMRQLQAGGWNGRSADGPAARQRGSEWRRRDNRTEEPSRIDREIDEEIDRINEQFRNRNRSRTGNTAANGSGEGSGPRELLPAESSLAGSGAAATRNVITDEAEYRDTE